MTQKTLNGFAGLKWRVEPPVWNLDSASETLIVQPAAATDFWQWTHYGFRADNGHFLHASVARPFRMAVRVTMDAKHQYDQAGLMIRLSQYCWLKTSVEFEPGGPSRLGVVVTNAGFSDWSTQDLAAGVTDYWLRVDRESANYLVSASLDGAAWTQLRIARLVEDEGDSYVGCGVYACCPKQAGMRATFSEFSLG